jgi:hypothetical protein
LRTLCCVWGTKRSHSIRIGDGHHSHSDSKGRTRQSLSAPHRLLDFASCGEQPLCLVLNSSVSNSFGFLTPKRHRSRRRGPMNGGGAMLVGEPQASSSGSPTISLSMKELGIAPRAAMTAGLAQDPLPGAIPPQVQAPSRKSVLNGLSELLLRRSSTKVRGRGKAHHSASCVLLSNRFFLYPSSACVAT